MDNMQDDASDNRIESEVVNSVVVEKTPEQNLRGREILFAGGVILLLNAIGFVINMLILISGYKSMAVNGMLLPLFAQSSLSDEDVQNMQYQAIIQAVPRVIVLTILFIVIGILLIRFRNSKKWSKILLAIGIGWMVVTMIENGTIFADGVPFYAYNSSNLINILYGILFITGAVLNIRTKHLSIENGRQ